MNNAVKIDKLLDELKDNIVVAGRPNPENTAAGFSDLCNYVTDWVRRKYDLADASSINYGYCFIWAYLVYALWPYGGVTFKTTLGHVVVVHSGLHYDSEHTDGRETLKGFCAFGYSEIKHINVRWMVWFWARAGKKLRELRRLVKLLEPKLYAEARDGGRNCWKNTEDFFSFPALCNLPEAGDYQQGELL